MDAETFRRILRKPCAGDGAIKWTKYAVECYMPEPNPDPFDGILPVSRMSDPLYISMCVPNEQHSFMDNMLGSHDFKEAIDAHNEKRKPVFNGK